MNKRRIHFIKVGFVLIASTLSSAHAQEVTETPAPVLEAKKQRATPARFLSSTHPYVGIGTEFPIFIGGDIGVRIYRHFDVSVGYGTMSSSYAGFVGSRIDQFANKTGYDSVVKGLMDSNHTLRASVDYRFRGRKGWSVGARISRLSAEGRSSITEVETLTGTQFTALKAILNASGRELIFNSDLKLTFLEAHVGYTFGLGSHLFLESSFGVSKIVSNGVTLSSNASNFDDSNAGRTLYAQAQSDLDSVLKKYGYVPSLGLKLIYEF